jgi:hypothetical protein
MNTIQASLVPLQVSENQGTTWLDVVCVDNFDISFDTQTTETNTFCGIALGVGATKHAVKGTAVCEASPLTGQATLNKFLNWQQSKERIMYRAEYPGTGGSVGSNFFLSGTAYVTNVDTKFANLDVVKFDFTLSGDGEPDINA